MAPITDRLLALRVGDVMTRDVVTVSENQHMSEVAAVLREHDVSAAPVVDDCGHCVGVVTATDFVKRENDYSNHKQLLPSGNEPRLLEAISDRPLRLIPTDEDFAGNHMCPVVQSVEPDASLLTSARIMCAQHIHRLLVIDERNHPVGVVSTMDIVAALINVVDEMNGDWDRRHT